MPSTLLSAEGVTQGKEGGREGGRDGGREAKGRLVIYYNSCDRIEGFEARSKALAENLDENDVLIFAQKVEKVLNDWPLFQVEALLETHQFTLVSLVEKYVVGQERFTLAMLRFDHEQKRAGRGWHLLRESLLPFEAALGQASGDKARQNSTAERARPPSAHQSTTPARFPSQSNLKVSFPLFRASAPPSLEKRRRRRDMAT